MTTTKRKTAEPLPVPDLFRLAEIYQMRRIDRTDQNGRVVFYECQLCRGRSADATGEIRHADGCPLERLRK
jgi:hypothetical protein